MAVIGSKGTYAQVQAPKDYLGNALSNIEQMNFRYREEKQRKEELEQAKRLAEQNEQQERSDKAFEKSREFKGQDYGNNRMNESSHKVVRQMADEVASLYAKKNRSAQDNARLTELYAGLDKMKQTANTLKSFITDKTKAISEGNVNTDIYGKGEDIIPKLLNIDKGEVFIDESGKMSMKLLDPETKEETVMSLDELGNQSYLESLMPNKVEILGKDGLVDEIRSNLKVNEYNKEVGNQKITVRELNPNQEASAKEMVLTKIGDNKKRIQDASQQLGIPYDVSTPEATMATKNAIANKILEQSKAGLNLKSDTETNWQKLNYNAEQEERRYQRSQDAKKKEEKPAPYRKINVQEITSGTSYNTVPVRAGDRVSDVNQPPKAPTTVIGTVLRKTKDGKKEIVITVKQKPVRGALKPDVKYKIEQDPTYEITDEDYDQTGEGKIKKYSSITDPQMVNDIIRTSLLDEEGNTFSGIQDYAKRNFGKPIEQGKATAKPKQLTAEELIAKYKNPK